MFLKAQYHTFNTQKPLASQGVLLSLKLTEIKTSFAK